MILNLGITASGKGRLAFDLARSMDAEINLIESPDDGGFYFETYGDDEKQSRIYSTRALAVQAHCRNAIEWDGS